MAEETLRQGDDGGDMGELPHQGIEWVMLEDFGLEVAISNHIHIKYVNRPSVM